MVVCERLWHKLNYFLFCRNFEKLFSVCAEILVIILKSKFEAFWLTGLIANGFGINFCFLICQNFEKKFIICVEILIMIIKSNSKAFQLFSHLLEVKDDVGI